MYRSLHGGSADGHMRWEMDRGDERGRVKNEYRRRGILTRSMRLLACLQVLGQLSKVLGKQ